MAITVEVGLPITTFSGVVALQKKQDGKKTDGG